MSLIGPALSMLVAVAPHQVSDSEFRFAQAQEVTVAGERPRIVLMIQSGEGRHERIVALVMGFRWRADEAEGETPWPEWWGRRLVWTADGLTMDPEASEAACPALRRVVTDISSRAPPRHDLPTGRAPDAGSQSPPALGLHQSYTLWSWGRDENGDPVQIRMDATGGALAETASRAIGYVQACWP